MAAHAHWQVQEAKQRFSEVLRAVEQEGPQTITRHGDEVAVIINIDEYRRLAGPKQSFKELIMAFPKIETDGPDVFDEIEGERKKDFAPLRDFEIELGLDKEPTDPQ